MSSLHKLGSDGKRMRFSPSLGGKRQLTCELHAKISRELPEELIREEILTRLPIKSVVRFKSVCKSWLSLFSDPQFIQQHNNLQNPDDNDCLVANYSGDAVILSRYQKRFALPKQQCEYLIGSARGLVCIRRHNVVFLWNPAIHQYKQVHLPSLSYNCLVKAGFSFDHVTNDYKVAIWYRLDSLSRACFTVYSSNSDSWIIHSQFDDSDYDEFSFKYTESRTPTTMVKDCPYWTSSTTVSIGWHEVILSLVALKFDATSNKFKLLPKFSFVFGDQKIFKVVNMRDLLTLMAYDACTTGKLDIYSLHEDGVWSKMHRFGPFEFFERFQNLQQGFKYGDEIVSYQCNNIYCYDQKTDTFECIQGAKPYDGLSHFSDCFTYTPNLVFLPGMTSIYSENQGLPLGHYSTAPLRLISSLADK